jgi:hypothetical protein
MQTRFLAQKIKKPDIRYGQSSVPDGRKIPIHQKNQDLKLWSKTVSNFCGGSGKNRAKKQQNC